MTFNPEVAPHHDDLYYYGAAGSDQDANHDWAKFIVKFILFLMFCVAVMFVGAWIAIKPLLYLSGHH